MTPANEVATWTNHTDEQASIQTRLMRLGVAIQTGKTVGGFDGAAASLECAYTGAEIEVAARQTGRPVWPSSGGDAVLGLTDPQLVGAWGLGITWSDRHATGIFRFAALHAWVLAGHPVFTPDSGLGN